jgi:hypothetical protein
MAVVTTAFGALGGLGAGVVGAGVGATETAGNVAFGGFGNGPFAQQPGYYSGQYVVVGDQLVPAAVYYQNVRNYAYNQRHGHPNYNGYYNGAYNGAENPVAATTGAAVGTTGNVVGSALNLGTLGLFNDGRGPISQQNW